MAAWSSGELSYAVITAVRDEVELVRKLASCLSYQTVKPITWIVVDTGSTDGTDEMLQDWAEKNRWTRPTAIHTPKRSRGGLIATAIETGLRELVQEPDVVVIVDADVSFGPVYFERLLSAFKEDQRLGIASGCRYEQRAGRWRRQHVTGTSVEAQCRAYRWECLQAVLPLEKQMGWDGIDEVRANVRGWRTKVVRDLGFRHHRRIGARERSRFAAWWREGRGAYYMGYRPYYLIVRALFRALTDPCAVALVPAYACSAIARAPRCADHAVRSYLRAQQSPLRLWRRAAEALGFGEAVGQERIDVLLVADPGGHLYELAGLRQVWSQFSRAWVTVRGAEVSMLEGERIFYGHGPTHRSVMCLIRNAVAAVRLVLRLRPAVILSTGSGLAVPFLWVGRLLGAQVLYVECSGRLDISLSGRLVAPFAHRLYVQWPDAASRARRAVYLGSVFFSRE